MAFTHHHIFLLPLLPLLVVAGGEGSCPAGDASSLLAFKRALSDPESHLVSWSAAVNCCWWSHVSCDATGVAGLHLAGLSLSSSHKDALAPLAGLTNIVSLDLSGNSFVDFPIPAGIFPRLPRLAHLNLSCSMSGSNSGFNGSVPPDMGRARMLVSLDLSQTLRSGLRVEDARLLADLPELEELYLDGVNLSMAFPGKSCWALSSGSPKLRVVKLKGCSIVNCSLEILLNNLTSITHLGLDGNDFSPSPVPSFLPDFRSLSVLRLAGCGLVGEFPAGIFQLKRLRILDVSRNPGLSGKLSEFPRGSALEELVLSDTNFTGELPASLGNLAHLANLDLSIAGFSGELPEGIGKMVRLTHLDLSNNNFVGRIPSLAQLKRLVDLDLRSNSFQGSISHVVDNLTSLWFLDFGRNSLSGSIPTSIFAFPSLHVLALDRNNFSGELHEFDVIGNNSALSIYLNDNHIQGEIPKSIFQLSRLEMLQISSNNFSGVLQLDTLIGSMPHLSYLDLSHSGLSVQVHENSSLSNSPSLNMLYLASCNLTRIPEFLQKQKGHLVDLDLSENKISGDIPNWIWKLEFLRTLNLSSNNLTGLQHDLPSKNLQILDLHSNQLQGTSIPLPSIHAISLDLSGNKFHSTLPLDIGEYLSGSESVLLAHNNLIGSIPSSICKAEHLIVLDLSENNLTGPIPPCLAKKMSFHLTIVNLHANSISGVIPDTFPKGCQLETLDFSGNKMVGQIPTSLKNCKGLQVLNLGNNEIDGTFPSWLAAMPDLRILALHSNRLQGRLEPASLAGFQKMQIIDLSSNNFSGNLCSSCFNSWKSMIARDNEPSNNDEESEEPFYFDMEGVIFLDKVTLTIKGSEQKLEKILTGLVAIDLSRNNFEGFIPEKIGNLRLLHLLNLSHNALANTIPRSIGNLSQLESLDLSWNKLTGEIPQEMVHLTFLSVLNLSSNLLVGKIPQGPQLNTLSSYLDNVGLCGFPLSNSCEQDDKSKEYTTSSMSHNLNKWTWIVAEIGFIFGFGVIWLPLVFCRRWSIIYFTYVDSFLCGCPSLPVNYYSRKIDSILFWRTAIVLSSNYCCPCLDCTN